jgi:nitric oxide reductase subunit B
MVLLDTFPVGVMQFSVAVNEGMHAARSQKFIQGEAFQTLTWMRAVGGIMFFVGGVIPLTWFVVSRFGSLKAAVDSLPVTRPIYEEVVREEVVHEPGAPSPLDAVPALRK